jgi:NAD(P)-dependent dehydrogenase (short-subunit alcohol dehydrogenase family)
MSTGKVILITGCANPAGIGYATARLLASHGHHVWATIRDLAKAPAVSKGFAAGALTVAYADVTQEAGVQKVVTDLLDRHGRLDTLINNAGYGLIGPLETLSIAQMKENFDANFFGALRMIQAVLPSMRRQRAGHIINISSIFCSYGLPGFGVYIASKSALETACEALAVEVAPWNIRVTNYQPGPVATNLSRLYGDRLKSEGDPYAGWLERAYAWVQQKAPALESAEQVAEGLAQLVEDLQPALRVQSSETARAYLAERWTDHTGSKDRDAFIAFFTSLPTSGPASR